MNQNPIENNKSIDLITEMISISRNKIIDDGKHFILWGVLVALCCFVQYFMIEFLEMLQESNVVWLILPIIGVPISIYMGKKSNNELQVKTVLTEIYHKLWLGFGISLGLIVFISIQYLHSPTSFILVLMGFSVYISYTILKFKPMLFGSIVFFCSSILFIYINSAANQVLLYGISVILGYIIPGFLLYKNRKSSLNA